MSEPALRSTLKVEQGLTEYWRRAVREAECTLLRVVKQRSDTRTVLLVEHPVHGLCVLKTCCPVRSPRQGLANSAIARTLEFQDISIFPEVYRNTTYYTLERYVSGRSFRAWMREDLRSEPLKAFFEDLKRWSLNAPEARPQDMLDPEEIRTILTRYVEKCFAHQRYMRPMSRMYSRLLLFKEKRRLGESVEALSSAAKDLRMPRAMMCGDMGNINVIVEDETERLYNIDYEFMSAGHWGFDAAYFVSSLFKIDFCRERRATLSNLILTDEYLGSPEIGSYIRQVTDLLIDIGQLVYRPRLYQQNRKSCR